MEKSELRSMLIDYLEGVLDPSKLSWLEDQINSNQQVANEYNEMKELMGIIEKRKQQKPDKTLEGEFLNMLDDEIIALEDTLLAINNGLEKGEATVIGLKFNYLWQIAAAVSLIAVGTLIGMYIVNNNNKIGVLTAEIEKNKQMVIEALENTSSPSNRIKGVNASLDISEPDDEIIDALIARMQNDENTNVRLAAIDALLNFIDNEKVNNAFIEGLEHQKDPIVQITLINILVKTKEKKALQNMQKIIEDDESLNTVKDEAQLAVYKLS